MLKIILSFGLFGDYNKIREMTLKTKLFYPLYKLYEAFHGSFLPLTNTIKGKIQFPHGVKGCFFSTTCTIGTGCIIMQHVTIGSNFVNKGKNGGSKFGAPNIGNNVFIGAGAKIIEPVTIGDNAKIGAGCIVVKDVPTNATCVMQSPRLIIKENNI